MLSRKDKKAAQERNKRWAENRAKLENQYAWANGGREYEKQFFASEYGPKVQKFLWEQLNEAIKKHSDMYEDNFRHAKKSDPVSVARFEYHVSKGCCGSWDGEVVGPDGETYLLGFNHGH